MNKLYDLIGKRFLVYDNVIEINFIKEDKVNLYAWNRNNPKDKFELTQDKKLFEDLKDLFVEECKEG